MACLGLVTFLPLRPLFRVPCFISRISVSTCLPAAGLYLRVDFLAAFFAGAFFAGAFFVAFFAGDFFGADFFAADFLVAFLVAIGVKPPVGWSAFSDACVAWRAGGSGGGF
jgi:hypothetical protein